MSQYDVFKPYKKTTDSKTKNEIVKVVKRLEKNGYAMTSLMSCSQLMSRKLHQKDVLFFSWDKKRRQSVIVVNPMYTIKFNKNGCVYYSKKGKK